MAAQQNMVATPNMMQMPAASIQQGPQLQQLNQFGMSMDDINAIHQQAQQMSDQIIQKAQDGTLDVEQL